MYDMVTYEIVRYIIKPNPDCTLNCTFPPGNRLINVVLLWEKWPPEVQKFKLNPKASIEVPVPFKFS